MCDLKVEVCNWLETGRVNRWLQVEDNKVDDRKNKDKNKNYDYELLNEHFACIVCCNHLFPLALSMLRRTGKTSVLVLSRSSKVLETRQR